MLVETFPSRSQCCDPKGALAERGLRRGTLAQGEGPAGHTRDSTYS